MMITPPPRDYRPSSPITPIRSSPPSRDSPMRTVELFPDDNDDYLSTDDNKANKDQATETMETDIEALEVVVCAIEDKVDLLEARLMKTEKNSFENITLFNRVLMTINVMVFAHLVSFFL
jgi:hypothetical protein